jgi:hypothetical protein
VWSFLAVLASSLSLLGIAALAWDGFRRYVAVIRERTEWLAKYEKGFNSNVEAMRLLEAELKSRIGKLEALATRDALSTRGRTPAA